MFAIDNFQDKKNKKKREKSPPHKKKYITLSPILIVDFI